MGKVLVLLVFLVLYQLVHSIPHDSEDDLLPYLRGMGWRNVEKELQKDMRLDPSIRPTFYDIHLNVSVRGYGGAEKSSFNGHVSIYLNNSTPRDEIELHAIGLDISKAELLLPLSTAEVTKIEYNRERETVVFTLPQTLLSDPAKLKIYYNGTAASRGGFVGLFEYWTKPEKKTERGLPTVSLVTKNEPTGARRWVPCFDEPDKKATFKLTLRHPSELTAYSNTAGATEKLANGLSETSFQHTVELPTYLVAFALTEQPAAEIEHDGHTIKAIGRNRMQLVYELESSINYVTNLPVFENVTYFPQKTDWLIVEDGSIGAMENPGLITSRLDSHSPDTQIHELAHMYFGNLVTLRSWEQIWINEGFATYFQSGGKTQIKPAEILNLVSHHDIAIHDQFVYTRTQHVYNNFYENWLVHYEKAAQLIRLIKQFIGAESFDRALNRYLIDNSFGNGDSEMMINYISAENLEARQILNDWVYQPGVALLTVVEENERVIIRQRRIIRSDFIEELRDTTTRWTIPLYYTINGVGHMEIMPRDDEQFIVNIPPNATFSIDESFPTLYLVFYKNRSAGLPYSPTDLNFAYKYLSKLKKEQETFICDDGMSEREFFDAYLSEKKVSYFMCTLKSGQTADEFLHQLILFNTVAVRNDDVVEILLRLNIIHPGVLLDFLVKEHENIDYIDNKVWTAIRFAAQTEAGGVEKLREIVRNNPSFGANFYHLLTRLFEDDFIKTEWKKRNQFFEKERDSTAYMI